MTTSTCTCGCGAMLSVTNARQACQCGCDCCQPEARSPEEEIAQLEELRQATERRLSELRAG